MNRVKQIFKKAIVENPIFALFLGLCPVLAVSNSFDAAFGMSLAVIVVLIMTNMIISAIRKIVPNEIRIPVYIIIIATVVTVVKMLMSAFMATVFNSLGVYLSLIVVNCIILGRAEAFASKNTPMMSVLDAVGMALGFTGAISIISIIREMLGSGTITIWGDLVINCKGLFEFLGIEPSSVFTTNIGAFLILGLLIGIITSIGIARKKQKEALGGTK